MDLAKLARKVERQLGSAAVTLITETTNEGVWITVSIRCHELNHTFGFFGRKRDIPVILKRAHEQVYRERGLAVWEKQGRKCFECGRSLIRFEIHHEKHRGKNGRDDRMENLRAMCPSMSSGCKAHAMKHGQVKTYRIKKG